MIIYDQSHFIIMHAHNQDFSQSPAPVGFIKVPLIKKLLSDSLYKEWHKIKWFKH